MMARYGGVWAEPLGAGGVGMRIYPFVKSEDKIHYRVSSLGEEHSNLWMTFTYNRTAVKPIIIKIWVKSNDS